MLILALIVSYFIVVFVVFRLFVPYLGFQNTPVPQSIPKKWEQIIQKLNQKSKTDNEFLLNAYNYLTQRYHGARFQTISKFWYSFTDVFAHKPGYIPCNVHNYLLQVMLIKSGRFREEDIKIKTVFLNFFIHQYLKVKVQNKWIIVDPNSQYMGVPFGKHTALFR